MAIPVARVHLAVAHAALPPLLPTPPVWKMLPPLLPKPPPCAALLAKLPSAKPPCSRADADDRWDAHKDKPLPCPASSSSSSGTRSASSRVRSSAAGHGSSPRKNTSSPLLLKPGRADSVHRWDAHKKKTVGSSSSSPSATSSGKWPISRTSPPVDKERRRPSQADQRLDDGESDSSTGSNSIDGVLEEEEDEEMVWKLRAMYAGPGFVAAAPGPPRTMLPMPTAFLVPVA